MNNGQESKKTDQEPEPDSELELDRLLEQSDLTQAALLKILHHVEKKQQGNEPAKNISEIRKKEKSAPNE